MCSAYDLWKIQPALAIQTHKLQDALRRWEALSHAVRKVITADGETRRTQPRKRRKVFSRGGFRMAGLRPTRFFLDGAGAARRFV
jgi:hypothetical protein